MQEEEEEKGGGEEVEGVEEAARCGRGRCGSDGSGGGWLVLPSIVWMEGWEAWFVCGEFSRVVRICKSEL